MTAQMHERLIYDGKEMSMAFCPGFPKDHTRIKPADPKKAANGFIRSTACYRRYLGTWEIKDGRFYLVSLDGNYQLTGDEPLFADWFSGVLRIPMGERVRYIHHGFMSVYEKELQIKITDGIFVEATEVNTRDKDPFDW